MGDAALNQGSETAVELSLVEEEKELAAGWWKFALFGGLLCILGVAVLGTPLVGTLAVKTLLAVAFVLSGGFQIIHAFSAKAWNCFLWNLLSGLLYLGCGIAFLSFPVLGMVTLTLALATLFFIEGFVETVMAIQARPLRGWGWLLFSGMTGIALSVLIFAGLPGSAAWAIGLMVAINILTTGFSMFMIGMMLRRAG